MKLSALLLALFAVVFVANGAFMRGAPVADSSIQGDASGPAASGPDGNSTNSTDEAEKAEQEDNIEEKMKVVQEMNSRHEKAKKKFEELRDLTAKSAEVSKESATSDATSTRTRVAVDGSIFQNNRADEALLKVRATHKDLMAAKMDAGMVVGAKPKGPCHQKRTIYEKRIAIAKARAAELDSKAQKLKAKAEAAALALELKLKRANDAAASVKDQSSHLSMDGRLDSARNATIAAKAARDEAAMLKEESARATDASDDALEDAMKIQKEMKAILDICKNKQEFLKKQEKEMEAKEEAADGDKQAQLDADAKAKAAEKKKEKEMAEKKAAVEAEDKAEMAKKKAEAKAEREENNDADAKKDAADAKSPAVKATKAAAAAAAGDDSKVEKLMAQLKEAKATIAALKAAQAAAPAASGPAEVDASGPAATDETAVPPAKKIKAGSAELEKESEKHAVIVSSHAKLTGNIEKVSSGSGAPVTVSSGHAKHNRETVMEQNVPISHTSEEVASAAPAVVSKPDDGFRKPAIVAKGGLSQ